MKSLWWTETQPGTKHLLLPAYFPHCSGMGREMEEQKQEKLEGQDKHNLVKERGIENNQVMQRQSLSTPQKQADAQMLSKQ